jgi:predicted secreted protein
MIRKLMMAAGLAALAASGPALAEEEAAAEQPKKEKKICRTEQVTGSLARKRRICMTEAEWKELNDRTRKDVDDMQGRASGAPRCINPMDLACQGPGMVGQ